MGADPDKTDPDRIYHLLVNSVCILFVSLVSNKEIRLFPCKRARYAPDADLYVVKSPHTIILSSFWMVNAWIATSNQSPTSKEVSIVPSLLSLIILFAATQL
jgi:hypothetical protein